jgi:hypothetical protein
MAVLFFSLYLALIWSIDGAIDCFALFVVFRHRRAGAEDGVRTRKRGVVREQDAHIQGSAARKIMFPKGDEMAIAVVEGCKLPSSHSEVRWRDH